jgi:hypothetical protein
MHPPKTVVPTPNIIGIFCVRLYCRAPRLPRCYPATRSGPFRCILRCCTGLGEPVTVELDHVFVCTALDAREADLLVAFGLAEGTLNTHPGQGTANRRFYFRNALLELGWAGMSARRGALSLLPHDSESAGATARPVSRPSASACARSRQVSRIERPRRSRHSPTARPTCRPECTSTWPPGPRTASRCYLPLRSRAGRMLWPSGADNRSTTLEGLPRSPGCASPCQETRPRPPRHALQRAALVSFDFSGDHLAEVEFDNAKRSRSADSRPSLPLLFRW